MGQGQSRLKYQQAVGVLLAHPSLSPNDISFWSQFWTLPSTPDEVFEVISPQDIRNIKQQNPGNLAILLHKAIGQLTAWIQRTTTAPDGKATHEFISALNCIRLITRIIPFLFEDTSDGFVDNVFWHNKLPFPVTTPSHPQQSQPNSPFIGNLHHASPSPNAQRANPPPTITEVTQHIPPTYTQNAAIPSSGPRSPSPVSLPLGGDPSAIIPSPEQPPANQPPARDTQPVPFALNDAQANEPAQAQEHNATPTEPQNTEPVENGEEQHEPIQENKAEEPGTQNQEDEGEQQHDAENAAKQDEEAPAQEPANPPVADEPKTEAVHQETEAPPSPSPASIPLPLSPPPSSPGTNPFEEEDPAHPPAPVPLPTTTTTSAPPTSAPSSTTPSSTSPPPTAPPPTVFEWRDSTLGGGDQPLAARLLDTLLQLLFLPHFTVSSAPPSIQQIQAYQQSEDGSLAHEQMPFYYFWAVGIGADTVIPTPGSTVGGTTLWANRTEALKCLLACFSQTLYVSPEQARTFRNRWLEHVVCKQGYFTKALFCSLINVVCSYDPIGWGVPYNHLMFRDDHEGVASIALQVLNVLLQYNQHYFHFQIQQQHHKQFLQQQQQLIQQQIQAQQQGGGGQQLVHQLSQSSLSGQVPQANGHVPEQTQDQSDGREQLTDSGAHSPKHLHAQQLLAHSLQLQRAQQQLLQAQQPQQSEQQQNIVLNALADMKRNKDFQLIVDAFMRLMANPIVATAARLPYSVKQLEWHHHILMLFWHLLDVNKKFLSFVIASDKCPQMLVPMMCFMIDNRKDASSLGVIQLCTFILLLLSGERDFAVTLNKPIVGARLPSDLPRPPTPYTHFDLLAIVAYRVILDGNPSSAGNAQHLAPVRECLLTALANASPFVKGIGMFASVSLVKLFEKLSDPRVLFASESVCRLVHLTLEIFNNVIQYQFEGNPNLIYSILRSQNEFSKLAHLKIIPPPIPPPTVPQSPQALQTPQPQTPQIPSQPQTPQNPQTPQTPQTPQNPQIPQAAQIPPQQHPFQPSQQPPPQFQSQLQQSLHQSQEILPQFIPTAEWLETWKRTLPLDIILKMITMVSPKIQAVCTGNSADEQQVLQKLQNTTLVGLLPAPHPILIRKYQSNDATQTWLLSYMWGSIFLQQSHPPLFFGTKVKLFVLHTT